MSSRGIDAAGYAVLGAWITSASAADINVVYELLHEIEWHREWRTNWYCQRDLATGDWLVWPREGLLVVIREFSDEDPETAFSVVRILELN
jgi:hypothetical protein